MKTTEQYLENLKGFSGWDKNLYLEKISSTLNLDSDEIISESDEFNDEHFEFLNNEIHDMDKLNENTFIFNFPKIKTHITNVKLKIINFENLKNILESKITIKFNNKIVENIFIDINILKCYFLNLSYENFGNEIYIPVSFFYQFNKGFFPVYLANNNNIILQIEIKNEQPEIIIEYDWIEKEIDVINDVKLYPYLKSSLFFPNSLNKFKIIDLNFFYKMLIIRFIPKIDFYIDHPEIESISITYKNYEPYFIYDICKFNFLETTIYLVPLSKDFKDLDTIKETFYNLCYKNKGKNKGMFLTSDCSIKINSNYNTDYFEIKSEFIIADSLSFYNGNICNRF